MGAALDAFREAPDSMQRIMDHVAGGESLLTFIQATGLNYVSVLNWINDDLGRRENYARAREARADFHFEKLDDVSDAAAKAETAVEVAGLRLKADNIKWKLARMSSRMTDKVAIGGDPDAPPIQTSSTLTLTAEEAYKRMIGG